MKKLTSLILSLVVASVALSGCGMMGMHDHDHTMKMQEKKMKRMMDHKMMK